MKDKVIFDLIQEELKRQQNHIELIASENFVSEEILEATGSILTNKYAEGYPNKRYYGGCQYVDSIESIAIERAKTLFGAEHANVQPHSGSQANTGVYLAILQPGDCVLGMSLDAGGHLTHGHPLNFSGLTYKFVGYGVDLKTETIDFLEVREKALANRPKLIVVGASAYPRIIDFKKFREIADEVGAYLMVDMAHIAGLVAASLHPSPFPYADFVTTTTHKTLRGPRGGVIFCKKEHAALIDRRVFPGMQGGPLEHVIAGKAICFLEAMQENFVSYQQQVIKNIKALGETLAQEGFRLVSGGTDNHMILVDLRTFTNLTGKEVEVLLDKVNITVNKNAIPFDPQKPAYTSGIRLGSPAMTTRGFKEEEFCQIGQLIAKTIRHYNDEDELQQVKATVLRLVEKFPIYQGGI